MAVQKKNPAAGEPLLRTSGLTKLFGSFTANDKIDAEIYPGELVALLGENGAGKSTFVKMLYGLLQPDEGQIYWQSQQVQITSPQQARDMGIGMVFQHFSLFETLTVAENIELALADKMSRDELASLIAERSASYGIPLTPDSLIADLSVSQRQRVEIIRCLLQNPKLLIMDEPTSVLTPQEAQQLFAVLAKLADRGCAVLFISHKLDEVRQLTERAIILRGGRKVAEKLSRSESAASLAEAMVGESIAQIERQPAPDKMQPLFQLRQAERPARGPFDVSLKGLELTAHRGEILGIAGVAGNGQSELMELLTGEWTAHYSSGQIMFNGQDISAENPAQRRHRGICFVPEERNGHAAVPDMTLAENMLLTSHHTGQGASAHLLDHDASSRAAQEVIHSFDVRLPRSQATASMLSGGNLQKFVVGREILKNPELLILSQPTWGVDIAAALFIRNALQELARNGAAVIVISQDLEEIFSISHRISVLHNGHLSQAEEATQMTSQSVGLLMGGAT